MTKKTTIICFALLMFTIVNSYGQKSTVRLNHIALYVTDLKVSTDFYMNKIGLDTIPEPFHDNKHTWLLVGPKSHLHLIMAGKERYPQNKNTHLCFTVQSVNDFAANLKKNNIPFENWAGDAGQITTRVDGVHQIYLRDPDGYWLEINDARD